MEQKVVKNVPVESLRLHESVGIVPEMSLEEWEELLESIKEKGIQVPVHALEDGRILDGRHRLKAAKELGIKEIDVIYHQMDDIAAIEFIRDTATKRRNLTPAQRAAVVLEAEDLCRQIVEEKRKNSLGNLKKGDKRPDLALGPSREKDSNIPDECYSTHREKDGEIPDGVPGPHREKVVKIIF